MEEKSSLEGRVKIDSDGQKAKILEVLKILLKKKTETTYDEAYQSYVDALTFDGIKPVGKTQFYKHVLSIQFDGDIVVETRHHKHGGRTSYISLRDQRDVHGVKCFLDTLKVMRDLSDELDGEEFRVALLAERTRLDEKALRDMLIELENYGFVDTYESEGDLFIHLDLRGIFLIEYLGFTDRHFGEYVNDIDAYCDWYLDDLLWIVGIVSEYMLKRPHQFREFLINFDKMVKGTDIEIDEKVDVQDFGYWHRDRGGLFRLSVKRVNDKYEVFKYYYRNKKEETVFSGKLEELKEYMFDTWGYNITIKSRHRE